MKIQKFISFLFISVLFFTACQKQNTTQNSSKIIDNSKRIYENNKYGFSMEVRKTWGSIQEWGESYTPMIDDESSIIGPDLPSRLDPFDHDQYYMDIKVFDDQNTTRKTGQSWMDFYKNSQLDGFHFYEWQLEPKVTLINIFGKANEICRLKKIDPKTEETGDAKPGFAMESFCFDIKSIPEYYQRTCRLIENRDKLYTFCYNENNNDHTDTIQSLKFDT